MDKNMTVMVGWQSLKISPTFLSGLRGGLWYIRCQAHILPNGVHAHGVGRGDLGQKQMGPWTAAAPLLGLLRFQWDFNLQGLSPPPRKDVFLGKSCRHFRKLVFVFVSKACATFLWFVRGKSMAPRAGGGKWRNLHLPFLIAVWLMWQLY